MTIYLTPPAGGGGVANVASGTTTVEGTVRLATTVEAQDVNNETLAVTPKGLNAQITSALSGVTSGVTYEGTIAGDNIPTLTTATKGQLYKIDTASSGVVAGFNWSINDNLLINADMGGTFDANKINKIDSTDSDLATVATSGDYNDLSNTPTTSDDFTANLNPTNYQGVNNTNTITAHLGAIDTALGNVGGASGYPTTYTGTSSVSASANQAYIFSQGSTTTPTVTLPDNTSLNDGDVVILSRVYGGQITLNQFDQVEATSRIFFFNFGSSKTRTIDCNRQQIHIRWSQSQEKWFFFDYPQSDVATTGDYNDLSNTPTDSDDFTANLNPTNYLNVNNTDTITAHLGAIDTALGNVGGGLTYTVVTLSSYNATANTHAHNTSSSANAWNVTLPATSSLSSGDVFVFSRTYNGSIVINKNVADSNCIIGIKSATAVASLTIESQPTVFYFIFDGTNFRQAQGVLGSGAELNADNTANNLVKLDFQGRLPAIDGSQLSNLPYVPTEIRTSGGTSLTLSASLTNLVYWLIPTAGATFTLTLPLTSTLSDGDSWTIQRQSVGDLVIQQSGSDTGAKVRFGASDASSHTINAPGQSFLITYDATSNKFYIFDQVFLQEISTDTTPQLGGDLDVNGNDIISASNGDIEIAPDGTGSTIIKGNATGGSGHIVLNCEQNSHGITLKGPPHSASATYTLTFPNTDGNADQVLKTDGSGNLDWVDQASGGSLPTVNSIAPSSNYTITTYTGIEETYIVSATANIDIELPSASTCGSGYKYNIKSNANGFTIRIVRAGGIAGGTELIDNQSSVSIINRYEALTLISNGSNWFII